MELTGAAPIRPLTPASRSDGWVAGSTLRDEPGAHAGDEAVELVEPVERVDHDGVVHGRVLVDEHVPEPDGTGERQRELGVEHPVLAQRPDRRRVRVGRRPTFGRRDVLGDVNVSCLLDGKVKPAETTADAT